jgi:hypothetical protein
MTLSNAQKRLALRWTTPSIPDVPPPDSAGYTSGWLFNAHSGFVEVWWSSSVSHGRGALINGRPQQSGSHGERRLFSTSLLALRAMRHEIEKACAERLCQIDKQIEKEVNP